MVLGENELFQGVDARFVNHHHFIVGVAGFCQGFVKLSEVVNAVADAAEVRVSKQVVLFVCVEWAGNYVAVKPLV